MLIAKRLADILTLGRAGLALIFAWLGTTGDGALLPLVATLLLVSWSSDFLDGALARVSGQAGQTWVGRHDMEVDVTVSLGVLIYLLGAEFIQAVYAAAYVLLWVLIFRRWGWQRDPAMLFQAPIYLWFIVVAMRDAPQAGWWLIGWIATALVITWPRFPREIVPGFLAGMRQVMKQDQ